MAKWVGIIGFGTYKETSPGVWVDEIIEQKYKGDMFQNSNKFQNSGNLNDDVRLSNRISIIADPYAKENAQSIKYITFMGSKWKVLDVTIQHPRLVLNVGGVYTENE